MIDPLPSVVDYTRYLPVLTRTYLALQVYWFNATNYFCIFARLKKTLGARVDHGVTLRRQ